MHARRSLGVILVALALGGAACAPEPSPPTVVPPLVPNPPTVEDYQGDNIVQGVLPSILDALYLDGGLEGCPTGSDEGCDSWFNGKTYGGSHTFDLYEPPSGPTTGRPVLIWIHGGFGVHGDKLDLAGPHYPTNLLARQLARGYVVISLNYRLNRLVTGPLGLQFAVDPGAAEDLDVAVRFFKANASTLGIDPERILLWGHSWGAWAAMMQAMAPGRYSPTWLPPALAPYSPRVAGSIAEAGASHLPTTAPVAIAELERTGDLGPIDLTSLDPVALEEHSPRTYIDATDTKVYAIVGDNDPLVPLEDPGGTATIYAAMGRSDLYRLDVVDYGAGELLPWPYRQHVSHPGANRTEMERFMDSARS